MPAATLPEEVVETTIQPTKVETKQTSEKEESFSTTPPEAKRKVGADWKPKSLEDALDAAFGDVIQEGAEAGKKEEPPKGKKEEAPTEQQAEITHETTDAELDKEIGAIKFSGETERAAFKRKTYELRDAKRRLKELETKAGEVETLQKRIEEMEKSGAPSKDLEEQLKALQEKFEIADREVAAVRIEKSVAFQEKIGKPMAKIEGFAKEIAGRYKVEEADVLDALHDMTAARGEKLSDIAADMKDYDRAEFYQMARDYAALQAQKESVMADAKSYLESERARQEEEANRSTGANREEWNKAIPDAWKSALEAAGIARIDGNDKWNAKLDAVEKFVRETHISDLATHSQAATLARASAWPFLIGLLKSHANTIAEQNAELERYRESKPGLGGGNRKPAATPSRQATGDDKKSFEDAVDDAIARAEAEERG